MEKKNIEDFLGAWGEGDTREIQEELKKICKRMSESIEERRKKLQAQIMKIESSKAKCEE